MSRRDTSRPRGAFHATLRHYHAPQRQKRWRAEKQDQRFRQRMLKVCRVGLITLAVGTLVMVVVSLLIDLVL